MSTQDKLSKKRLWIKDIFYPALVEYSKTETDYYIQQSIHANIGWVNCIESYNIEPTDEDIEEMTKMYKEATGEIDEDY